MFEISLLLLLAWGALAFGAEYAWAYAPLLVFCLVPGIIGLRARRGALPSRPLLLAIAALLLAVVIQITAPAHLAAGQSEAAARSIDFGRLYALVTMRPAPEGGGAGRISIAPARTVLGLAFLAAFTLLFAACTRGISALGPKRLARGIVILGVVVAFVGMIQGAVKTDALYGFWRTPRGGVGFAPFINENHFSGWMAMVLSVGIGAFAGDVAGALKRVEGWRDRILWFSTPRASGMILTAFALAIMALSMVITFSRGGLVGLVLLFAIGCSWLIRRQSGLKRLIGGVCLAAIVTFAAMWGGAGKTLDQFSGAAETMGGRRQIWQDTANIIRDFPLTGTGLNTFGIAMLHYQAPATESGAVIESHNDYLQLAAEGGLLLGIPILFALGVFVREVRRRFKEGADDVETYWLRAGAVTGLSAIAVMEIFDFTLQMPGAAAMFVVLAAIAIHRPNHLARRNSQPAERGRS